MKKTFLIIAGYISLLLGIVGIVLPLLPTTPFILLAATCFFRSSDSLYNWIIQHKIFGKIIRNYRQYKAIPKKAKILSISFLWGVISSSIFFIRILWLRLVLLFIAFCVTTYILKMKTLTKQMMNLEKHSA